MKKTFLIGLTIIFISCNIGKQRIQPQQNSDELNNKILNISTLNDSLLFQLNANKRYIIELLKLLEKEKTTNIECEERSENQKLMLIQLSKLIPPDTFSGSLVTISEDDSYYEKVNENEFTFENIDSIPVFPGGKEKLNEFIKANLKYPVFAKENDIKGTVYIEFIVEKDGSLNEFNLLRTIGGGCDEEAIRLLVFMPKWNPGIHNSKPVKVKYVLPIKFGSKNSYK